MTRCREVGHIVPTGFWTCDVELDRSNARYAFHCAACHKIHQWLPEEIWVTLPPGDRAALGVDIALAKGRADA